MALPTGTLTFLFSDIEASTQLWEREPEAMRSMLAQHDAAQLDAIASAGGELVKRTGDGFHAVFNDASSGVAAAVAMQRFCVTTDWSTRRPIRVRIGLHTGESQLRDGDYYGPAVNRAARLMAAAHGGQIVCSASTGDLAREALGDGTRLVDLGEHRLRDLARSEQVFQITHPELPRDFPALRSIDILPGNLPAQPNRFIGRHDLLDDIFNRLAEDRVLTLLGPGGVGKTRLALQVAAAVQPDFRDGVWFVDLSTVTDAGLVAAEILETLDYLLADGEDPIDGLRIRLRRRELLLVLDNCEQVVDSVARVADAIASAAKDIRVLATSREGLGIPAEQLLPVPPLDTRPDGDAVRLFLARAQATRPNFVLNENNHDTVVELCTRLDGIPLAIELAAARSRSLAPEQILERIDQRFRLLKSGDRTSAARHQTLHAAVDWSYELLSPREQATLNRLAIFAGSFTLDAAEAVVSDESVDAFAVLDHLEALVDKSLVVADDRERGIRYRLLETIRHYAAERLELCGETGALHARHAAYYQGLAETSAIELHAVGEIVAMDRLDDDLDNLGAMLDWRLDQSEFAGVASLLARLDDFVTVRDHNSWATDYLNRCIDALSDDGSLTIALCARAWFKSQDGFPGIAADVTSARSAAQRAGMLLPLMATATEISSALIRGDSVRAYELCDILTEEARDRADHRWLYHARTMWLQCCCLANPRDPGLVELAAQIQREIEPGLSGGHLRSTYLMGAIMAHLFTDPREALRLLEEKLRVAAQTKSRNETADAYFFTAMIHRGLGDSAQAAHNCHRALVEFHDIGSRRGMLMTLSGAAGIALKAGHLAGALTVLAGLRRARSELDAPGSKNEQDAEASIAQHLERELGDQALHCTEALDLESTIDFALALLDSIEHEPTGGEATCKSAPPIAPAN